MLYLSEDRNRLFARESPLGLSFFLQTNEELIQVISKADACHKPMKTESITC